MCTGELGHVAELLIAANPQEDSRLPYLLRLPQPGGDLLFRTSGTWPRVKALYCHQMSLDDWPADAEIVERLPLQSCQRRGAAIDVILQRPRENRSQLVFTTARGREVVFWQSPRTRKQARPNVRTPTARAQGIEELQLLVDAHERYAYTFNTQQVSIVRRALPCGDYGIAVDGLLVASVERKSAPIWCRAWPTASFGIRSRICRRFRARRSWWKTAIHSCSGSGMSVQR